LLGRFIAFHNYRGNIEAIVEGMRDKYYYGRRPNIAFMPAFRNVYKQQIDFLRGYMVAFAASWGGWQQGNAQVGFGEDFKNQLTQPDGWRIFMIMQGKTIPKYENHVRLNATEKDAWGIPQRIVSVGFDDNDKKMWQDFLVQDSEMLERAGCNSINAYDTKQAPGLDIHEMGGVRMGKNPKTSLLNAHNQLHTCKNVFVTDGACMTSVGNQNPSLTFRLSPHVLPILRFPN
jgi:choline dehydrogenase-like flavoprotein